MTRPLVYGSVCSGIEAATVAWHPLGWRPSFFSEIEPFARAVLKTRYPDVPCHGDFTTIKEGDYPPIDLLVGGTPCFVAGTLVLSKLGLVPIESVQVGDEVLTHMLRWRRVSATMSREGDTFLLRGQGHSGIETTAEHPFYARDVTDVWTVPTLGEKKGRYVRTPQPPRWIDAEDAAGTFWSSPAVFPDNDAASDCRTSFGLIPRALTAETAWVMGAWLGDGWSRHTSKQAHLILCAAKHEADEVESRLRSAGFAPWRSEDRTTFRFSFGDRSLTEWTLANFGTGARGKTVPAWLLSEPEEIRQAFYDGYHFADGCTVTQRRGGSSVHSFTTVSKRIAIGLRLLCNSLGKTCSVSFAKRPDTCVIEGRTVNQSDTYQVRVYESARSAFFDQGMAWGKVRSAEPTHRRAEVFNIEVEEDESYVADGLVVHNCQAFSLAGLRGGLADARGNLALAYLQLAARLRPSWLVWENVPGVLSSLSHDAPDPRPPEHDVEEGTEWVGEDQYDADENHAFSCFLAGVQELGYGFAYRVLDAQHFGVPQRRRRVFLVGRLGDWRPAAAVLLEPHSLRGDPAPSRGTRERPSGTLGARASAGGGLGTDLDLDGGLAAHALTAARGSGAADAADVETYVAHTLRGDGFDASEDGTGRGTPLVATDGVANTLTANGGSGGRYDKHPLTVVDDVAATLNAHGGSGRMDGESETFVPVTLNQVDKRYGLVTADDLALSLTRSAGNMSVMTGETMPSMTTRTGTGTGNSNMDDYCIVDDAVAPSLLASGGSRAANNGRLANGGIIDDAVESFVHNDYGVAAGGDVSPALTKIGQESDRVTGIAHRGLVRRLTPVECARLQGFSDTYLDIEYRKKPAADGPKYKALGNSMAVPVMAWIGGRIDRVHARRPDVPDAPRAVAPSVHPFQRRGPRRPPRAPATDLLTDIEQET